MKKLIILALALSLGGTLSGCSTPFGERITSFIETIKAGASTTVSPEAIYVAANAYDAVEVTATNYLNMKKCPTAAPFCRSSAATKLLIPAIRSGRVARNDAIQFMNDHPGQLGSKGLYDALTTATDSVKKILNQYKVAGVS